MAVNEAPKNGVANKVALVALGCPKNTVDAEVMLGDLQKRGFSIVRQPKDADVGEILLTFKHLVIT
jgi:ribosomal protein S12 methylthiotransferase